MTTQMTALPHVSNLRHRDFTGHRILSMIVAGVGVSLSAGASLRADDVQPGVDMWATPPGSYSDEFSSTAGGTPLPAGFFGPGSDPFDGTVSLQGKDFQYFGTGGCLAPADTIIWRKALAPLPLPCPATASVPIEIIALSLTSSSPITVTYNGGSNPELWDVHVCLSDFAQQQGLMTITHSCPDGGSFSSSLPVTAKFTFTRQSDLQVRVLDTGDPQWLRNPVTLTTTSGWWVHSALFPITPANAGDEVDGNCDGTPEALPVGTSNFYPGIFPSPCTCSTPPGGSVQYKELTEEQALLAAHGILPPQHPQDSDGDGIPDACETAEQFCPEPAGQTWCAALQSRDCQTTVANETCLPSSVVITASGFQVETCACYDDSGVCGPVTITPGADVTFSCVGLCPVPPNQPGDQCLIHITSVSSGQASIKQSQLQPGDLLTCDCAQPPPPPVLCPLPVVDPWCMSLQTIDCVSTDPANEICLPKKVAFDGAGNLIIELCDCFSTTPGCGPVDIQIKAGGYTVSCLGPCPVQEEECQVHFDTIPQGVNSVNSSSVGAGVMVTCGCVAPPPVLCQLPASAECAALQSRDCPETEPATECLPKVIRHHVPAVAAFFPDAGTVELTGTTGYVAIRSLSSGQTTTYLIRESPPNLTRVIRESPVDVGTHRTIATELVAMELVGVAGGGGGGGGAVMIRESPTRVTSGGVVGAVSEVTDYPADSFFDLFVEIDIPELGVYGLYNDLPMPLEAHGITALPPRGGSFNTPPGTWVELLEAGGIPTGYVIVEVVHDLPPPPPEWEVIECACIDPGACHVTREFAVDPTCMGVCQTGQECVQRITIDPNDPNTVDYSCECVLLDKVVCEPQTSPNPTHPNVYWYDVTPQGWGRCDFHVLVLDANAANYSAWTINPWPGNTWQFSVHAVGAETWASWYTPDCAEPLAPGSTHRFQLTHYGPNAWSHWRTTYNGTSDPYDPLTFDHSGNHAAEQDGYGYRVHVPQPPSGPTEACCLWDGRCVELLRDWCCDIGGTPQGAGTDCATTVCPPPAPIDVGMNIDVHQDNPLAKPNDFHIEGMIESERPPVLVEHIDDLFPNFIYTIVEDPPGNGLWYKFTADWSGHDYQYCDVLHLGLKFQVVCHNVMIDLIGWWTLNGDPIGGATTVAGIVAQPGYWPVLGFDVEDNIRVQPQPEPPDPRGQHIRIQSGNGDGTPEPGEFHVDVVQMDLVALTEPFLLSELRVGGEQEQLTWVEVLHSPSGPPISAADPKPIEPDSFFDVFFELPQPGQPTTATAITIPPGGYLLARQLVRFQGNGTSPPVGGAAAAQPPGEELRWFWEMHGAHGIPQPEACCMPDGSCQYLLPSDCVCNDGMPQGTGTVCSLILSACCLPDGSCRMVDPLCCDDLGGVPSPIGATVCMGDQNSNGTDDACEVSQEACCLQNGSCVEVEYNKCVALGGDPQGPNTICDMRYCPALKWAQPPTYGPLITPKPPCFWGWDEVSDYFAGPIVADDWACDTNQPITDIHWWGSYQNWTTREPPPLGMGPVGFHIGVWTDVPAEVDRPFSHPGKMIWQWMVQRELLNERWVGCDEYPGQPPDTCFRYDFNIPEAEWFYQTPTTDPTIYWISISALNLGPQQPNPWGWKTREHFFNDDAVRIFAPNAPVPTPPNNEFIDGVPIVTPDGDSWDVAFVLTTRSPGPSKWDQWPNPDLPGLHAHDGITLADNWECQGGEVTDFHWWGNYELDALGNERRGGGINCFNISIHKNRPDVPWCVPQDPAEWGVCALFEALHERDTGLVNSEGSKVYLYDFYFEPGFKQVQGEIYWLNLEAFPVNAANPALWRWQENARTPVPRLCPAAERTPSQAWHTIPPWPDDPPRYSEMAFRVTSTPYPPRPDPSGIAKNRHLSMVVPPTATAGVGPGPLTALHVTPIDLQHPIPANLPQYPPRDFTAFDTRVNGVCVGGSHAGHHCDTDADCRLCIGGLQDRKPCASNADCAGPPAGVCPALGGVCSNRVACTAAGEANGCARWVGKPGTFLESQDNPGGATNRTARLQCTPYYHDWGSEGVFHVTGAEIVPSSTYEVVNFALSCMGNEDTCAAVSPPLRLTTARSGDVEAPFNPPATSTQPDAIDVTQLVNKFKNVPGAPVKAIAQLQPNLPELNADINALDIVAVVDAVKQLAYAYSGPCACPSAVTCGPAVGSVACTSATPCVTAFGAGSLCVKTCSDGANDGDPCINHTHCPGGLCGPTLKCAGGSNAGQACTSDANCPESTCGTGFCRDRCGRCKP